jgi:predicted transcriptional regulator
MEQLSLGVQFARMTRAERLDQFESIIYRANTDLPESEIARRAGLKKTPYTRGILDQLVSAGTVHRYMASMPNGSPIWLYEAWESEQ